MERYTTKQERLDMIEAIIELKIHTNKLHNKSIITWETYDKINDQLEKEIQIIKSYN